MEKLKYRAWDKEFEEMLQVQAVICKPKALLPKGERMEPYILDEHNDIHYFDDIEILPYTGLKDKKGVEIYEGDILKFSQTTGIVKFETTQFKIDWVIGAIGMRGDLEYWVNLEDEEGIEGIRVIGNVFENKELLDQENE